VTEALSQPRVINSGKGTIELWRNTWRHVTKVVGSGRSNCNRGRLYSVGRASQDAAAKMLSSLTQHVDTN
jgi:hypothetical protein